MTPMPPTNKTPFLILASQSPRRQSLLEQAGLSFAVVPGDFDEASIPICEPVAYARILAREKAGQISTRYPDSWVVGADTIVYIDSTILGKPVSKNEARRMLKQLSGRIR